MTLKEIAAEAGVSISTVSRVINQKNTKAASKDVQDRIWEIVRRTNYIPNSMARNLKLGKDAAYEDIEPKSIACIFARTDNAISDPFFSQLAKSIEQESFRNNYFVKYSFSAIDINNPRTSKSISDIQVDGVVILGRYDKQLLKFFTSHYQNVVYTGLNPGGDKYDQVVCDGYEAAMTAITYLTKLGHKNIGYIGEQTNEIRFSAYKDALSKQGLTFKQANAANVKLSSEGGYTGANILLDRNTDITAIFCANDKTAIGAMHALKERNLRIPSDISIISIDDIDTAQYLSPMLTTVHIPVEDLGKMTAKILIDRICGGHKLPMKTVLPFYIVKRESCGKLNLSR